MYNVWIFCINNFALLEQHRVCFLSTHTHDKVNVVWCLSTV